MELAALAGIRGVESVAPVHAKQSDHRKEDAHTHAGAAFDLERIELSDVRPGVTDGEGEGEG